MVKIIETNISVDDNANPGDAQSRVIEVSSWEDYVNEIREGKCVNRNSVIGNLMGVSLPKKCKINFIVENERSMVYIISLWDNSEIWKTAYLV